MFRAASISVTLLLALCVAFGCDSQSDTNKKAMVRVMKADEALAKQRDAAVPQGATPSQIAQTVGWYCSQLEAVDMSDCPADFRIAYKQHMRAWRETQAAVSQLPDSFGEGVLMGAINGILRGELDGGSSRLQGDLNNAVQRVKTTWEEVDRVLSCTPLGAHEPLTALRYSLSGPLAITG